MNTTLHDAFLKSSTNDMLLFPQLQIHLHGADFQDTLSDFFSLPVLPPEYGGEGLGIDEACQDWTNQLLQSENLLQQIESHPTGDIAITPEDSLISEEVEPKNIPEG